MNKFKHELSLNGTIIDAQGPIPCIDLWYPGPDNENPVEIQVGLSHVRAADDVRIKFDFARNEWVISRLFAVKGPDGRPEDWVWRETHALDAYVDEDD